MAADALIGSSAPSRLAEIINACGLTGADALLLVDRQTAAAVWASPAALDGLQAADAAAAVSVLFDSAPGQAYAARLRRLADGRQFRLERMTVPGRGAPVVAAWFPVTDAVRPMALLHLRGIGVPAAADLGHATGPVPAPEERVAEQPGTPTRILWEADAAGRLTRLGSEVGVLGARALKVGDDLPALVRPIDPGLADRLAEAAACGGSVSRARVAWPVEAGVPLAVEIGCAALRGGAPGLRGFLAVHGRAASAAPLEDAPEPAPGTMLPVEEQALPEPVAETDREPSAHTDIQPGDPSAPPEAPAAPTSLPGGNIVHFPMMRLGPVPANFGADLRPASRAEGAAEPIGDLTIPRWAEAPPPEPDAGIEGLSEDERDAFEHIRKVLGTRPFASRPPAPADQGVPPGVAALLDRVPVALRFELQGATHANPILRERLGDDALSADLRSAPEAETVSFDFAGAPANLTILQAEAPPVAPRAAPDDGVDLLDLVTDGHLHIDETGAVRQFSAKARRLLGLDAAGMGRPFASLLSDGQGAVWQAMAAAASGPEAPTQGPSPIRLRHAAGHPVAVLIRLARSGGALLCALTVDRQAAPANDTAEAARREAERTSALKSEFLAKVSHEIRTPLNAILGFAEVIRDERLGPVGNARYLEYLRDIHASGTHVMSLVNDLLDLSRIEAGRMDLNLAAVDANAIVQSCVNTLQTLAHRERVIVRLSLTPRLPHALADERSLRQIALNLLSNAIKFNEPGGQVIVSTALSGPHAVAIRIRDTGIGMSEEEIEAAMEPFRQLSTVNRTGSGLGLPLTKALVEANCASMSIKSTRGQGTLVEVTFPLVEQGSVSLPAE